MKQFTQVCGLFAAAAFFFSCSTVPSDTLYSQTRTEEQSLAAAEIERKIVLQYVQKSAKGLEEIKQGLDTVMATPTSDSGYLAFVHALYADYYLLKGNKAAAKKMLAAAVRHNRDNEYAHLITVHILSKNTAKQEYLTGILNTHGHFYRLRAELGAVLYGMNEYTNALVAFDASLPFLPEEYTARYGEKRAHCQALYTVDTDITAASSQILDKKEILLSDMATLTQENTYLLDFITGTAVWKTAVLTERLKQAGWFAETADIRHGFAKRKDSALFLWHILLGNDSSQQTRYSSRYAGKQSPIQDVPVEPVYFDAILGTVEEDIIPLSEGRFFEPERAVSGLEFYTWLKKLEEIR